MRTFVTESCEETEKLGQMLAVTLKNGQTVALYGDLGVGKTAFIRGLARGLGYSGRVTSPTFSIVNEYIEPGLGVVLAHFDLYRLEASELFDVGWYEILDSGTVCAVEWAQNAGEEMPADAVRVHISGSGDGEREIIIEGAEL